MIGSKSRTCLLIGVHDKRSPTFAHMDFGETVDGGRAAKVWVQAAGDDSNRVLHSLPDCITATASKATEEM